MKKTYKELIEMLSMLPDKETTIDTLSNTLKRQEEDFFELAENLNINLKNINTILKLFEDKTFLTKKEYENISELRETIIRYNQIFSTDKKIFSKIPVVILLVDELENKLSLLDNLMISEKNPNTIKMVNLTLSKIKEEELVPLLNDIRYIYLEYIKTLETINLLNKKQLTNKIKKEIKEKERKSYGEQ